MYFGYAAYNHPGKKKWAPRLKSFCRGEVDAINDLKSKVEDGTQLAKVVFYDPATRRTTVVKTFTVEIKEEGWIQDSMF